MINAEVLKHSSNAEGRNRQGLWSGIPVCVWFTVVRGVVDWEKVMRGGQSCSVVIKHSDQKQLGSGGWTCLTYTSRLNLSVTEGILGRNFQEQLDVEVMENTTGSCSVSFLYRHGTSLRNAAAHNGRGLLHQLMSNVIAHRHIRRAP